ncbi:Macrophage receptor MARCO [Collichthys lucidus]|uniref:Macrophage receptor MARCO n=1 Tax=Collichthys lucidus TaxID=240159 RepID=A0A4U5U1R9_COLLU|nr:Macrophage receptor MARCO [Collichthys lucidus]
MEKQIQQILVPEDHLDLQDPQGIKDQELRERKEHLGAQAFLDPKVTPAPPGKKDLLDLKVPLGHKDRKEILVHRDLQVHRDLLVLKEIKVSHSHEKTPTANCLHLTDPTKTQTMSSRSPAGPAGAKGERGDQEPNVRLVPSGSRGRVEVKVNGAWGTVCDDNFSTPDGKVICRMLGFQTATDTFTAPAGTGKIWLDDLKCTGAELDIMDCPHNGVGVNNCQHSEDAGVQCA